MSIAEIVPSSPNPGPFRETPELDRIEQGNCPHSGQPCAGVEALQDEHVDAVRQLREGVSGTERPAGAWPDGMSPAADAAVEAFYVHWSDRMTKIHCVLSGSCLGGCELSIPPAE